MCRFCKIFVKGTISSHEMFETNQDFPIYLLLSGALEEVYALPVVLLFNFSLHLYI